MTAEAPAGLLARRQAELKQAARTTVGAVAAYIAYRLIGFEQGYWAVFTVVIVLQGSIGGTLGAAIDRLIGTIAGGLLGGLALVLLPHTLAGMTFGLGLITVLTTFAAAIRPQLRVAPVTAAIVLLSHTPGIAPERFVLDRIAEIALGGVIGVLTSMIVFPARSRELVVARAEKVLDGCAAVMRTLAVGFETGAEPAIPGEHAALRKALAATEAAMADAEREKSSRLADHGIPTAVPRTLWRIRNDLAQVTRGLEGAFTPAVAAILAPAAAQLLRDEADYVGRCGTALAAGADVAREDIAERYARFPAAVEALRGAKLTQELDFAAVGRLFGVIFALEQLHANLTDLADRIDEAAEEPARTPLLRFWRR